MRDQPLQIGFIGTGTMGGMLVRALLHSGTIAPGNIWAANRSLTKLKSLSTEFDGLHCVDPAGVAAAAQILFICVKPADIPAVLRQIHKNLRSNHICVFLTNVFSFEQMEGRIPARIAKLIPSIVQRAGSGVALLSYGSRMTAEDSEKLEKLLAPTGKPLVVPEAHLRIFADVASCGPAFLAACLEELSQQARKKHPDISAPDLTKAAIETLTATAELLRSGIAPRELVRQVAVPGGMTDAGLQALRLYLQEMISAIFDATQNTEQKKRRTISLEARP